MDKPFTTMDPYKRDEIVAYLNSDESRIRIIKALERRAEPLTTEYLKELLWEKDIGETIALLTDMEANGIVKCMSRKDGKPSSWDLTIEGKEVLYALGTPHRASQWHLGNILGTMVSRLKKIKEEKAKP
ncbi:MAG: hypothetical protein ABH829_05025 [archaeon]